MSGERVSAGGRLPRPYLALLAMTAVLTACGGLGGQPAGPFQTVELEGRIYRVEQITASTWTATPPPGPGDSARSSADLVKAIEKASACRVTDSNFGQQGAVLNAQVDCGSRLRN